MPPQQKSAVMARLFGADQKRRNGKPKEMAPVSRRRFLPMVRANLPVA
jgi:hypothetical protein